MLSAAAGGAVTAAVVVLTVTSAAASETTATSTLLSTTASPQAAPTHRQQVAATKERVAPTTQRVAPAAATSQPSVSVAPPTPAAAATPLQAATPVPVAAVLPTATLAQQPGVAPALAPQQAQLLNSQLVVTGLLACKLGGTYTVTVTATELGSRPGTRTSTVATGTCLATAPQPWSVTVQGTGGTFVPVLTTYGKIVDSTTKKATANVDERGIKLS
ncbi:MAG: hypothetical protein H0X39_02680 [Actinobacteria bacterium]|nr:hypothetical protein [Actinomycetota bacterium]